MTTAKWIIIAAILAAVAATALHVASLRAKIADAQVKAAALEEQVRARDARIAGLETVVAVRDKELAAHSKLSDDALAANETLLRRLWEVNEILSTSTPTQAKPGEITDDKTNRAVVRHLNGLVPSVVRESTAAPGNHRPAAGDAIPVPEAVQ